MANQLLNDKLAAIMANQVTLLATSNIGCSLHLSRGLESAYASAHVMHPVEIIAKQMGFDA
jgi:glycolate oxidase iron-sulfur subunit